MLYIVYIVIVSLLIGGAIEYLNAPEVKLGSIWLGDGDTPVRVIGVSKHFVKCEYLDTKEVHVYSIILFKIFTRHYKDYGD